MAKKNGNGKGDVAEAPAQTTALATIGHYAVIKADPKRLTEIIRQNTGPRGINRFDLDKISIPTGGGTRWLVPTLKGDESVEQLDCIIIFYQDGRVYWDQSFDETGGGSPPDCTSVNLQQGMGKPGGLCHQCPLAQFGSATRGGKAARGQACREIRVLFCLLADRLLPIVVTLPPTSVSAARKYMLRLASNEVPYWGAVTRLTLSKEKSADGIPYSTASFAMVSQLGPEEVARIEALAKAVAPQMQAAADLTKVQQGEV
jgi:hypothetical protein